MSAPHAQDPTVVWTLAERRNDAGDQVDRYAVELDGGVDRAVMVTRTKQ